MSSYVLVENRQIILIGPMNWRPRFIQSELQDLEIDYAVPPVEQGYIKINDNLEIFPVVDNTDVIIDEKWEDPVGPFWTFNENEALQSYQKKDKPIDQIKQYLRNDIASKRYIKESSGITFEIRPNVNVTADTSRDGRAIFVQVHSTMPDNTSVDWKFPEGWLTITKEELSTVIAQGFNHIQTQFLWEKTLNDSVDTAQTIDELKQIYYDLNPETSIEIM